MSGRACLFFLHGSGGSGNEIRGFLESVPLPGYAYKTFREVADELSIDIIAPTADSKRYSAMGGERCNVWFDRSPDFMRKGMNAEEDVEGADNSFNKILLKMQEVQSKYDHIFLGGLSMGGGLSLHALRKATPSNLRGLFSMGSFLVQSSVVNTGPLNRETSSIPVLMMHGMCKYYNIMSKMLSFYVVCIFTKFNFFYSPYN